MNKQPFLHYSRLVTHPIMDFNKKNSFTSEKSFLGKTYKFSLIHPVFWRLPPRDAKYLQQGNKA